MLLSFLWMAWLWRISPWNRKLFYLTLSRLPQTSHLMPPDLLDTCNIRTIPKQKLFWCNGLNPTGRQPFWILCAILVAFFFFFFCHLEVSYKPDQLHFGSVQSKDLCDVKFQRTEYWRWPVDVLKRPCSCACPDLCRVQGPAQDCLQLFHIIIISYYYFIFMIEIYWFW